MNSKRYLVPNFWNYNSKKKSKNFGTVIKKNLQFQKKNWNYNSKK